jgi:hypothetical protein
MLVHPRYILSGGDKGCMHCLGMFGQGPGAGVGLTFFGAPPTASYPVC